mgnify:CR=1 FL=1
MLCAVVLCCVVLIVFYHCWCIVMDELDLGPNGGLVYCMVSYGIEIYCNMRVCDI